MNQKFVELLKSKFLEGLEAKTGWGKNEVKSLFERCLAEAAVQCLDGGK